MIAPPPENFKSFWQIAIPMYCSVSFFSCSGKVVEDRLKKSPKQNLRIYKNSQMRKNESSSSRRQAVES